MIDKDIFPEYRIDNHFDTSCKFVGCSVHKRIQRLDGSVLYEHCGYVFDSNQDAENWIKGIYPKHYVKIDWDIFPGSDSFIHINLPIGG